MQPHELRSFGRRLRALRDAQGLTQAALARRIGRHQTAIGPYERDEYLPARDIVETLADVLETTPEYLYFGRSHKPGTITVIGNVAAGGLVIAAAAVARSPHIAVNTEQLVAYEIVGRAMEPVFKKGGHILVAGAPREDVAAFVDREVLAELADGRILLRLLGLAATAGRFDLTAYNAPTLHDLNVVRVWRIFGNLAPEAMMEG